MSLRARIVAAIAAVLLVSAMLGAGLAGWRAKQALREELAAALVGGRQTVQSAYEDLPRSDHPARDLSQLIATFDGNRHLQASLLGPDGRLLERSRTLPAAPAPPWFAALVQSDLSPARLPAPVPGGQALVLAPVWANDVGEAWAQFLDLVLVLGGAFVLGSALVWLTIGRALKPLADFLAAFQRIGSGDYRAKAPEHGPRELARLGAGINDMTARLAAVQARNLVLERQLLTLQDEERADVARDLHDEIGPHLFAVNVDAAMVAQLIAAGRPDEAAGQVKAIQASVGHMQRLVRDILARLRPAQLVELGLGPAIEDLVAFWRARHPEIRFDLTLPDDESPIGETAREAVYRVVQEGLNNAVRHGRPGRIEIAVSLDGAGDVTAQVSDDGAGASSGAGGVEGGGFGLVGMRERVTAAHGRLTLGPGPAGRGWTVLARLPAAAETAT
ncbi:MAG: HAMP domain-containing protein [Proteobacteria bacterium]|nr:HAMP domain-containing protein [Pseudomonadota bacterium]